MNHSKMAPFVEAKVADSASSLNPFDNDVFYMATVIGGEIKNVVNTRGGPPLKIRKVQEFTRQVDLRNEAELAFTRRQFRSMIESETVVSKRERTLAEFVLDLKRRKSVKGLATVRWSSPQEAGVCPPMDITGMNDGKVESRNPMNRVNTLECCAIYQAHDEPTDAVDSQQDQPFEPLDSEQDDETLSDFLKKRASTKCKASSSNSDVKVFKRYQEKVKAAKGRIPVAGSGAPHTKFTGRDNTPSTIVRVCEETSERREQAPIDSEVVDLVSSHSAVGSRMTSLSVRMDGLYDKSALRPESGLSLSPSSVLDHQSENSDIAQPVDVTPEKPSSEGTEKYLHLDPCGKELIAPSAGERSSDSSVLLDHQSSQAAVYGSVDNHGNMERRFHQEDAYQFPFDDEVTLHSNGPGKSLSGRGLESLGSAKLGLSNVQMRNSELSPQFTTPGTCGGESSVFLGVTSFCTESFNSLGTVSPRQGLQNKKHDNIAESTVSLVSPMELEQAEERIDALLDTLVVSDDLLPNHLSTSVNCGLKSSKKRKRASLIEPANLISSNCMGSIHSETMAVSCVSPSPALGKDNDLPLSLSMRYSVENVLDSADGTARQPTSSETACSGISSDVPKISKPNGLTNESILTCDPKKIDTSCTPGEVCLNNEERTCIESNTLVPSEGTDISGSLPESVLFNEDSGRSTECDAKHAHVASTSKAGSICNLTDSLTKRNRKTFSPKSRLKLLQASRPESVRKPIFKFKIKQMKSNASDKCPSEVVYWKIDTVMTGASQDLNHESNESSAPNAAHEMRHSDMHHSLHLNPLESDPVPPPTETTKNSSDIRFQFPSELPLDSEHHKVPDTPEHTGPHVSCQSSEFICSPEYHVYDLPLTERTSPIGVDSKSTGPITSTETAEPSERLKSILKTGEEPLTCRGICKCPRCISTRDQSVVAREFITSQMKLAENITTRLIQEMRVMRTLVEDGQQSQEKGGISDSCEPASEKAKGILESAAKIEDWAVAQIHKLGRDSKRVCRLIETGPRRTIFADEAGSDLEHVRILPMKKTLKIPVFSQ